MLLYIKNSLLNEGHLKNATSVSRTWKNLHEILKYDMNPSSNQTPYCCLTPIKIGSFQYTKHNFSKIIVQVIIDIIFPLMFFYWMISMHVSTLH